MTQTEVLKQLNKALEHLYSVDSNTTMGHDGQLLEIIKKVRKLSILNL